MKRYREVGPVDTSEEGGRPGGDPGSSYIKDFDVTKRRLRPLETDSTVTFYRTGGEKKTAPARGYLLSTIYYYKTQTPESLLKILMGKTRGKRADNRG